MRIPSRSRGVRQFRAEHSAFSRRLLLPIQEVIHNEVVSGFTLLLAALAALLWANSPWSGAYEGFVHLRIAVEIATVTFGEDLRHWINDGLMTIFFFVVGLEIKRELVRGDLADRRRAALPMAAAAGGMILPALIYLGLNAGTAAGRGWGIPMATDIAFALGALALLGDRIPSQLKVFLLALAIVDDIGAILVIAVFYTEHLSWPALAAAAFILVLLLVMVSGGLRNPFIYLVGGVLFWGAVFQSGVHATIAGVILGLLPPATSWFSERDFADLMEDYARSVREADDRGDCETVGAALGKIEELTRATEAPLDRLERLAHPWVSYLVLPWFALVNAGVTFSTDMLKNTFASAVTLGVLLGLVLGKTVGISTFSWIAVRLGLATLPKELSGRQIGGTSLIGAIGFTVALFITDLAFDDAVLEAQAKAGILAASLIGGLVGYTSLRLQRARGT